MNLLALDTSGGRTGVALFLQDEFAGESTVKLGKGRDSRLSIIVHRLMEEAGMGFAGLDAIAVSNGPGSFTGLRVGAAYAKGICFCRDIPYLAVDSMEAVAFAAGEHKRTVLPLIIMKGDEVYFAAFKWEAGEMRRLMKNRFARAQKVAKIIEEPVLLTGEGALKHRAAFDDIIRAGLAISAEDTYSTVRAVGILGMRRYKWGALGELSSIEPDYIQLFPRNV